MHFPAAACVPSAAVWEQMVLLESQHHAISFLLDLVVRAALQLQQQRALPELAQLLLLPPPRFLRPITLVCTRCRRPLRPVRPFRTCSHLHRAGQLARFQRRRLTPMRPPRLCIACCSDPFDIWSGIQSACGQAGIACCSDSFDVRSRLQSTCRQAGIACFCRQFLRGSTGACDHPPCP
jgi:hypothetical protein